MYKVNSHCSNYSLYNIPRSNCELDYVEQTYALGTDVLIKTMNSVQ
jgi:hypothetical protein